MAFDDRDAIALGALALLVMRHEAAPLFGPFAVDRMLDEAVDLDHHGFGHLGGDHRPLAPFDSLTHCLLSTPPCRACLPSPELPSAAAPARGATSCSCPDFRADWCAA